MALGLNAYDVSPIDGRLLFVELRRVAPDDPATLEPKLIVTVNWFEELERLMSASGSR